MGRRPGVTSVETRSDLLAAAIEVMSRRGCSGARVAEIAAEAGVTSGAIYKHFASKDDLLSAAILEHLPDVVSHALASGSGPTVIELTRRLGSALPDRALEQASMLIELMATAGRDEEVARLFRSGISEREVAFTDLIRLGQERNEVDGALDSDALARFTTMLALGSLVAAALDLEPVDRRSWDAVISRMTDAVRPEKERQ